MADRAAFNALWQAWLPEGCAPARACVSAELASPDYLLEIVSPWRCNNPWAAPPAARPVCTAWRQTGGAKPPAWRCVHVACALQVALLDQVGLDHVFDVSRSSPMLAAMLSSPTGPPSKRSR